MNADSDSAGKKEMVILTRADMVRFHDPMYSSGENSYETAGEWKQTWFTAYNGQHAIVVGFSRYRSQGESGYNEFLNQGGTYYGGPEGYKPPQQTQYKGGSKMKSTKILNIISILLLIVFLPLQADKKVPQIPLKDLINPNSPSYVPYAYPKTEFEIIEDFRYAVKLHFGPREGKRSSQVSGYKDNAEIILGLLGDNPSLRVMEIIEVQDLISTSPSLYYFLLRIDDNKGEVVALGRLLESGLLGGVTFFSEKAKFKPFKAENQVKEIVSQALGPIKIDKMERVDLSSTISNPYTPLWKISTPAGLFFVDYIDNVYSIERENIWTNKLPYPDPTHQKKLIIDSLNNKVIFLAKKEKK